MEPLTWSWKGLYVGLRIGLVLGLLGGLGFGLAVGQVSGVASGLLGGVAVVLVFVLVFVPVSGLRFGMNFESSGKQLTKRSVLSPKEGIRRFIKDVLFVGLAFVLICVLVFGLFVGLFVGSAFVLVKGLIAGLIAGLIGWLVSGLVLGLVLGLLGGPVAIIKHYALRFWLWQARCTPAPWQYLGFFDDTVDQLLLRKVGGGYIFIHRLLLDYFASLETIPTTEKSPEHVPSG